MSTGEKRKKLEGREYESPPPIPCTPKELDILLDNWIANGIFKPNHVSKEPIKDKQRDPRFCARRYHKVLGTPQIGPPQNQGKDSRADLTRSTEKSIT